VSLKQVMNSATRTGRGVCHADGVCVRARRKPVTFGT
jgi:hypothetical protein